MKRGLWGFALLLVLGCTTQPLDRAHFQVAALKGHVALVNVWATWCHPCREELPSMVKIASEFAPRGVTFVALNQDSPSLEDPVLTDFLASGPPGLSEHVAVGSSEVFDQLQVSALPTTVVFDRQGKVRARFVGVVSADRLREALNQALQ